METNSETPIRCPKSFLHPIPMMAVDVNVDHSLVFLQQLKNGEHAVVDIAEPRSFKFLGVMEPP